MLFSKDDKRYLYEHPPLIEVICQLRFPTILSIGTTEPVEFQDVIRGQYPRYAAQTERVQPKGQNANAPQSVINYNFVSSDGKWKVNLTNSFIALSTRGYTQWEDFAQRLDFVLAGFIQVYEPPFFERIGLRYINAISRHDLDLEGYLWADLIEDAYLGILGQPDINEATVSKCSLDVEMPLEDGCRMKLHSGPGILKTAGQQAGPAEVRFILDGDFSASGNQNPDQIPERLGALHDWASRMFQGAVSERLHEAMGPTPL